MGDFNARVGNFQNVETFKENVVNRCLLHDSEDCVKSDYGNTYAKLHKLDYPKGHKCIPIDKCAHMFTILRWRKCD